MSDEEYMDTTIRAVALRCDNMLNTDSDKSAEELTAWL